VLLSAFAGVWITGGDNNIFTQIGFIVLVGLATKNAILIVEFARTLEQQGLSAKDAVLEAARLRLRPIIMTSLAFIIGVSELAHVATQVNNRTLNYPTEIFLFIAVVYFILCYAFTTLSRWLERRLSYGR